MEDYLMHHGVLGQKWGVRRFQNSDGSLTAAGKKREAKKYTKELNKLDQVQTTAVSKALGINSYKNQMTNKASKYMDKGNQKKAESRRNQH